MATSTAAIYPEENPCFCRNILSYRVEESRQSDCRLGYVLPTSSFKSSKNGLPPSKNLTKLPFPAYGRILHWPFFLVQRSHRHGPSTHIDIVLAFLRVRFNNLFNMSAAELASVPVGRVQVVVMQLLDPVGQGSKASVGVLQNTNATATVPADARTWIATSRPTAPLGGWMFVGAHQHSQGCE
jgi:hypothetical protein